MNGHEVQEFGIRLANLLPAVTQTNPFGPETEVFRVADRVFMLTSEIGMGEVVSLKCEPEYGLALRQEHESIIPGYHLNKRHWISIAGGASITEELLRDLVINSYELVIEKLPKKQRPLRAVIDETYATLPAEFGTPGFL
ncbi:MmcQ/YjbR family DNA-binding protein [Gulosibacter chungangensis]|uniref:MmcQ/YjbR family DNA-binding protein n=1 Tax=Gulosibacter chungangensis TaxID=979746 RepID=A0A7J5BBB2_9MICO|nr:MmcQ/YjbR family DNA-binding protein [Gulosibacter chungangensis]KAB1643396.1 MmcQ/YjbR family DNA-binding protein [Gulosibacter chungangensis]